MKTTITLLAFVAALCCASPAIGATKTARLLIVTTVPVNSGTNLVYEGAQYLETQALIIRSSLMARHALARLNLPTNTLPKGIERVDARIIPETSVIEIVVQGADGSLAADLANALADEFVKFKKDEQLATAQASLTSLTAQALNIHKEITKVQQQICPTNASNCPEQPPDDKAHLKSAEARLVGLYSLLTNRLEEFDHAIDSFQGSATVIDRAENDK